MKISNDTIQILKNFATINTNMLFREGNQISTINTGKSIFARATIAETIPREFAIYDLNSLLQLLTFSQDIDIDAQEKFLHVNTGSGTFEYYYCDPTLIVAPPNKNIEIDENFKFDLTSQDVQNINKTIGILAAPSISVTSKKGVVKMRIGDRKNSTSNSFNKEIGSHDEEFDCVMASENFKLIPDEYHVTIARKNFFHFKNKQRDLNYWIAAEPVTP